MTQLSDALVPTGLFSRRELESFLDPVRDATADKSQTEANDNSQSGLLMSAPPSPMVTERLQLFTFSSRVPLYNHSSGRTDNA